MGKNVLRAISGGIHRREGMPRGTFPLEQGISDSGSFLSIVLPQRLSG